MSQSQAVSLSDRLIQQCHASLSQLEIQLEDDTDVPQLLKVIETCAKTATTVANLEAAEPNLDPRDAGYAAMLQQLFAGQSAN